MKKATASSELASFCNDSSIYGLRYFAKSERPWERTFWISFLVLGGILSYLILNKSLTDWKVKCFECILS